MRRGVLVVSCLVIASLTRAGQTDETQVKKSIEVRGTVLESGSQNPISKALVILREGEEPGLGTYTDVNGNFTFHAVRPGTYLISTEHNGFVADPKFQTQPITVSAEDPGGPIALKLNRTGAISGRVLDADGGPVTGASIQLMSMKGKKRRMTAVGYATSDDRGTYRAYDIPPGRYKLLVTYQPRRGQPVRMQKEKNKAKELSADGYGTTYYPGTLDPEQATAIQVDSGGELQGMDIGLLHAKSVRVKGHVSGPDASEPPPLVMVLLDSLAGGNSLDTQAGPDGSFEFAEVTPGKYALRAMGLLQHGTELTGNQLLEVGDSDMDGVQLALGRAQTVTGSVLIPADRKLSPGLIVVLRLRGQLQQFGGQSGGLAKMNDNGTFSVETVAPGDYDVVVGNAGQGDDLYVSGIRSGDVDILASGIHIGASVPPPIELTLTAKGAEVHATVVDDKGKPVPEAHVMLVPDPPRTSQLALQGECQTDASGNCAVLGMAPGDYHAIAYSKSDTLEVRDPDTVTILKSAGTGISVALGDQKSIKLTISQLDDQ